jgi:mono/diheme cytochrome c family protein
MGVASFVVVTCIAMAGSAAAQSAASAAAPPAASPSVRTTMTGVYGAEQARRGGATYASVCLDCHSLASQTGVQFNRQWLGRPLWELFRYLNETMPQSDPGSLTLEEYSLIVAYMLEINGMPAGSATLPSDSASLSGIRVDTSLTVGSAADSPTAAGGTVVRSTTAGVYTAEQAAKGSDIYAGNCSSCHTRTEHSGSDFATQWAGDPLWKLYSYLSEAMPESDPGSLTPDEYAQVVAYMLRLNRMPEGMVPLPTDSLLLRQIRIDTTATDTASVASNIGTYRRGSRVAELADLASRAAVEAARPAFLMSIRISVSAAESEGRATFPGGAPFTLRK